VRRQVLTGRLRSTAARRKGRTASWPAAVFLMRHRDRVTGIYVRVGDTARYVTVVPK
jgi:hypothetical protein